MAKPVHLQPRRSLSPTQELIWTSQRLAPESPHQNMALVTRFGGPLDPTRFLKAVDAVVADSDALRTTIRSVDGVAHPTVLAAPPSPCRIARVDRSELDAWMHDRIATPIDVSVAAYESVLVDLGRNGKVDGDESGEQQWAWFVNIHHLAIDAAGWANFFNAVASKYHGEKPELPRYSETWPELLESAAEKRVIRARDHWAVQPPAEPTLLYEVDGDSTTRAERINIDMATGRQVAFDAFLEDPRFKLLSGDLSQAVALALATSAYLARLGNETVTIGVPIHHRSTKASKNVIGPLVELFPLRIEIDDEDTFVSLHKKIGREFFALLSNALPGTSPRQSFDVVLNVHGATLGDFGQIPATTRWIHPGHIDAHHLLRVQALDYDGSGTLELGLDVNHRGARSDQRQRSGRHFAAVFDAMLDSPEAPIHSISLLDGDERLLLEPFTTPTAGSPVDGAIPDVLAQRLVSHASRATIQDENGEILDGREVESRIAQVASQLRGAGYGKGDLIGVEMGVSLDAVVAIHGIQRAGAAFVPIDPEYPDARRDHIRQDSGAKLSISSLSELDELPVVDPTPTPVHVGDDDLAYVIYTSGSTGLPKGVPITYRGLSEYLGFAYSSYIDRDAPTMPLFTSLSFDLTITALFLPLLSGGLMTIHNEGGLAALREIVDQGQATLIKATPSHLELLVRMLAVEPNLNLSGLIVGGEAFMTDLADRLLAVCGDSLKIFNEYGPTEGVVGCMIHRYNPGVDPGPEVPIGKPAPGVGLHILDRFGHPVPVGVSGELYISRPGMTTGYLGRDDLNATRFVVRERSGSDEVLYRTGDLVRMSTPETMVYLGRIDEQIKLGGIRLEPGEIEYVAQSVPGVRRAVARVWTPQADRQTTHCVRCGLPSDVPDITIDGDGICTSCHQFELVAPQAESWFRSVDDLSAAIADAREKSTGDYDVIHLISGGKDSTYALYKLVELGARVFAITLDNGFIAEVAKANVRRATTALGVDHEFVTIDGMNEIFRDSLERFSNVCNGCYKAIYTIALAKAEELGVPAIVTGLSRGQFFETRLVPGMFGEDRFDPAAIDEMVREARHVYHTTPDAVSETMDVEFLADGEIFDRITFIDFYRYVDVPLAELYETLDASGTWLRPPDSGRSTNCLINSAGIFVHKIEQGHHNYAAPYSWDVRLGHKTRDEAMYELDDPMDDEELAAITSMLAEVGYEPQKPEMLTLWVEADDDVDLGVLEEALAAGLPAHSIPRSIQVIEGVPLTTNGKVDVESLPAPEMWRSSEMSAGRRAEGRIETDIARVWSSVLGLAEVSATDDFFALGGTSLHALEMIVRVSEHFDLVVPESLAFKKRTIAQLAEHIATTAPLDAVAETTDVSTSNSVRSQLQIPTLPDSGPQPLSAGEEAMLYEWRLDPTDRRYNVARLYRLGPDVDRARLDDAIRTVVAHQPALRTSYGIDRNELETSAAVRFGEAASTVAPLSTLADTINGSTFDLVHGPLMSVHHLTSEHPDDVGQQGLLIRTHHIVSDAGSLDVLWDQIDLAYRGEPLPELESTYAEHAVWQSERTTDPAELWSPSTDPAELRLRPAALTPDGYVHRDSPLTASQLRAAPAPTLFANALTALSAAIRPFHDGEATEITITSSVRDHPAVGNVVGYFLNPLPLLVEVKDEMSMSELAVSVADTLAMTLEHRTIPFGAVVSSARERGLMPPTGRIMLAVEDLSPAHLDGQEVEHEILASGTAVNDLTFFVQIRGERIEIGCEYRGATIGRENAEALLDAFGAALEHLVDRPDGPVSALSVAPDALSGPQLSGSPVSVQTILADVMAGHGESIAVSSGGTSLTYAEVDEQARAIAARLRGIGVLPGDRVALCLPRSTELIPAIWAIWMLGASYVPIDVSQPASRLTALLSAAGVRAAVAMGEGHPGLSEVRTVLVDRPDAAVLPIVRPHTVDFSDEAYVIFTSGSTGQPKGVSITHGNLEASLRARKQWYYAPVERYLLVSSAGFDSSVAGIFWTLADGGELVIPTEHEVHNVDALLGLVSERRVTHGLMVPSLWGAMLQRDAAALSGVHTMIVAGEACQPALVEQHFAAVGHVELVNEYGPTEATVWATAHRCVPDDGAAVAVPIGEPIPGMIAEVVDSAGSPTPIDVAGELWLSGPGVSPGYLRSPDADDQPENEVRGAGPEDEAFIGGRHAHLTYRTGDLVVRRSSGSLDFLGRVDDQLSVGGVRVDPLEVEGVFSTLPGVEACLVTLIDQDLVAFVEPRRLGELSDAKILRTAAEAQLPTTHVPRYVRIVESLPRNVNGKLDRTSLDPGKLTPASLASASHSVELEQDAYPNSDSVVDSSIVARVVEIFSAAFDGEPVTPTSDFFDLGGDSLRAVAVVSMLENEFGRRIAIGELIDSPTPLSLVAAKLDKPEAPVTSSSVGSAVPASAKQQNDLIEWLRASGSKRPLIVLPPGGGNLLRYAPLVRSLRDDVPVVGIRLPGADARSDIVESIEGQAEVMLDALDSVVESGPYRILGWSTGGLLAWEMARLLIARGDEVEGIVLVDTVMAGLRVDDTGTIKQKYQEMLKSEGVAAVATEGAGRLYERASFALARRRYRAAREAGETPTLDDAERQLGPVIRRAAAEYSPKPQDVPVVYVSASESDNAVTLDLWADLHDAKNQSSTFEVIEIDGVHFLPEERCIIGPERVGELVEKLEGHLDL